MAPLTRRRRDFHPYVASRFRGVLVIILGSASAHSWPIRSDSQADDLTLRGSEEVGRGRASTVSDSGSRTGAGSICQVRSDAVSFLVPTSLTCADALEQRLCSLGRLVHTEEVTDSIPVPLTGVGLAAEAEQAALELTECCAAIIRSTSKCLAGILPR
jgi:hypothetical protein